MEPERLTYKRMIEIVHDVEHVLHVGHCARDTVVNKIDVILPLHSQGHTICWRDYNMALACRMAFEYMRDPDWV